MIIMRTLKRLSLAITVAATLASGAVVAGPLPVYNGPAINLASPACLSIGDGVGCSLPLLNVLAGFAPTRQTDAVPPGYVLPTPQGALAPYIVLQAGGGAPNNGDLTQVPLRVEDGFKSNDGGSDSFRATGRTSTLLGNMSDPGNNALVSGLGASADLPGTWDVGLQWLIGALTVNGDRRQIMVGFDYNQPQNATTSLNYWALITVRDLQDSTRDVNYEIRSNPTNTPYNAFSTGKTIDSKPASTDFATVNGVTCVSTSGPESPPILPLPGGNCPAGYEIKVDNAQSTANTEIVAFLPELSSRLESLFGDGYDVISVRMAFGCFGGTAGGGISPGSAADYLSDGGVTRQCESGGFGDVFLLAGAPEQRRVPEPATLSLMLLACVSLLAGVAMRRRRM